MINRTVGNYKLVEKLGDGGMGAVYKGIDLMVERVVAVKMLRPEIARQPEIVERFRTEAVTLAKLNHPNIATLYSFFREDDEFFMVMEFVVGHTLEPVIRDSAPMPIGQTNAICSQVLDAVEHAHSYGILHRDIKPANIMLTGSGQVKVTDFGIARALGKAHMTREGSIVGTLEYLAPERIRGQEADIRSDLYSVGVVLYEMLSGHLPFERDSEYELMQAHLEEIPPPFATFGLKSIPPELEKVVAKALAKDPADRFGTAGEFRSALAGTEKTKSIKPTRLAVEPSTVVKPTRLAVQAPATSAGVFARRTAALLMARPHWKSYAALSVAVVLAGLILALFWSRSQVPVEVTKPTPAPVIAEPTPPAVSRQPDSQFGTAPQPSETQQGSSIQEILDNAPPAREPVAGLPAGDTGKEKSAARSAAELERRKAALKALGEDDSTAKGAKTKKKRDRRTSALDALQE